MAASVCEDIVYGAFTHVWKKSNAAEKSMCSAHKIRKCLHSLRNQE